MSGALPRPPPRVLREGELRSHERFGPDVVNRGAVLWECEWDGGVFESGVMLGGIFRSGEFRSGVFWAGYWKGGSWSGGLWHHGFGPDGRYRPRGTFPGVALSGGESTERPIVERESPRATVFAGTVFGDVPRLWLACLKRALPPGEFSVEVFDDSAGGTLDERTLPGAAVLRRGPGRPDFQVAYNDAVSRATTPLLAFVDTDVFWLSRKVWPCVMKELDSPNVAAVSCVSRTAARSHGTFAVVMKTAIYRDVLRKVPGGFVPFVEGEAQTGVPGRWRGDDTGDRMTRAAKESGFDVPLLNLDDRGAFVRFDAVTISRLVGRWVGAGTLAAMAVANPYFRRGILGSFALARLHDRLFPNAGPFELPISRTSFWRSFSRHPRALVRAVRDSREFAAGARRIRGFLSGSQPGASTSP